LRGDEHVHVAVLAVPDIVDERRFLADIAEVAAIAVEKDSQ